jgi:hypothetical protein
LPICADCTDWYREVITYENLSSDGRVLLEDVNELVWSRTAS